jgi:hypothetical protein
MDQAPASGLPSHSIHDLRRFTLGELARQARNGDRQIQDIVRQILDGLAGQPPIHETIFHSTM